MRLVLVAAIVVAVVMLLGCASTGGERSQPDYGIDLGHAVVIGLCEIGAGIVEAVDGRLVLTYGPEATMRQEALAARAEAGDVEVSSWDLDFMRGGLFACRQDIGGSAL